MSAQNVTFGKLVCKVPQVLANQRISVVYSMSFCSSSFFLFGCEILGYGHYFHERKEKKQVHVSCKPVKLDGIGLSKNFAELKAQFICRVIDSIPTEQMKERTNRLEDFSCSKGSSLVPPSLKHKSF